MLGARLRPTQACFRPIRQRCRIGGARSAYRFGIRPMHGMPVWAEVDRRGGTHCSEGAGPGGAWGLGPFVLVPCARGQNRWRRRGDSPPLCRWRGSPSRRSPNAEGLAVDKSLSGFDFDAVPTISKEQVMVLVAGGRSKVPICAYLATGSGKATQPLVLLLSKIPGRRRLARVAYANL